MLQSFDKLGWCAFLARTIYTRGRNCEQKSVIGVEPNVLPPGRIPNLRQSLWRFLVEHGLIFLFGEFPICANLYGVFWLSTV